MISAHRVTEEFENAVSEYTGAPYAIATTSCTMAIFLSLQWLKAIDELPDVIGCPKRTYVSVPMQIIHVGSKIHFDDFSWEGFYRLGPTPIIDSARLFTSDMFVPGSMMCTSHHWGKTLGIQQGGCILTSDAEAAYWLKRARFDGRTPGVPPIHDRFQIGWHAYMSPEIAAEGLMRLALLPKHNDPLPKDDYPDLSKAKVFQPYMIKANHLSVVE